MRPLSSLRLAFAAPTGEPGKDTPVTQVRVFTACIGTAAAFGSALARRHGSDLLTLRLLFVHKPAVRFLHRRRFGSVASLARLVDFPSRALSLSRLSALLIWRTHFTGTPEPLAPCWVAVATDYPLGNCDSPGLETCPEYLTRLETVSNRLLPPGSYSLAGRRANIARGAGESCLPHLALAGPARRG